jgi:hypothetical protein
VAGLRSDGSCHLSDADTEIVARVDPTSEMEASIVYGSSINARRALRKWLTVTFGLVEGS